MIDRFDPTSLGVVRAEVEAALAAISAKHGIGLTLGKMRYNPSGASFTASLEGQVEALANAEDLALMKRAADVFNIDLEREADTPDGKVKITGYRPTARSKRWIISVNGKDGYVVDQKYVSHYFKKADADVA